ICRLLAGSLTPRAVIVRSKTTLFFITEDNEATQDVDFRTPFRLRIFDIDRLHSHSILFLNFFLQNHYGSFFYQCLYWSEAWIMVKVDRAHPHLHPARRFKILSCFEYWVRQGHSSI
ncbi:hypothetical protein L9F63_009714, partial [Diploptera punctata]